MFQYHNLNPIAKVGTTRLGDNYQEVAEVDAADAILVRSANMHELEFSPNLKVIARAGAGVNNIPLDACAEKGIVVFNTPGANANGVKELVIAGMLLAARDIVPGINWVEHYDEEGDIAAVTEKKKSQFGGTELQGKKLGVIGLGAIGVLVANAAHNLGMKVYGFDPYMSVDSAWQLSRNIQHAKSVDEIYKECDYISVHVPSTKDTKGMIDKKAMEMMKDHAVVLNFSRDNLVHGADMVEALEKGLIHRYVTDFPTAEIAKVKGAIVIPHLGASTEESEDNCAIMACDEVKSFLEQGNIIHSVNFPATDLGIKAPESTRITIMHRNIPNMLGQFTSMLADENINIPVMSNKSRGEYAYTVIEVEDEVADNVEQALNAIEGVLRVRIIR